MSVHGSYLLKVFCDSGEDCPRSAPVLEFAETSLQNAVRKARAAGWQIRPDSSSSGAKKRRYGFYTGTATCPECVRRKKET